MSRVTGRVERAISRVQNLLTDYLLSGYNPSTELLQEAYYEQNFDRDSREQRSTIKGCIERSRDAAMDDWERYAKENSGRQIESDIDYEMRSVEGEQRRRDEINTASYEDFVWRIRRLQYGRYTQEILDNLGDNIAVAVIFRRKVKEFAMLGHHLLISTQGGKAVWYWPDWWQWNEREFRLYKRTMHIIRKQLMRGLVTRIMLPSGEQLPKVIETTKVVSALLEDTTSWKCNKCSTSHLAEQETCVICGTPKDENDESKA